MYNLPDNISSLNAIETPASPIDPSAEAAVWDFLNTDELFQNLGYNPQDFQEKEKATEAQPSTTPSQSDVNSSTNSSTLPADLKSFIEQFASESSTYSLPFSNGESSTASTPAGVCTSDIIGPWKVGEQAAANGEDRPSGAKKLKSLGAGVIEIEEDKRRRNTEASARFRMKKKEREQKLDKRARELEDHVAQLSTDKAALEKENDLLRSIVLAGSGTHGSLGEALAEFLRGVKRKREE